MKKIISGLTLLLVFGLAGAAGDPVKGKQYYAICAGCHGPQGLGNADAGAPKIAGQHSWYLARQLRNFRAGIRGAQAGDDFGPLMANFARTLPDDQAIDDVASYIQSLGE